MSDQMFSAMVLREEDKKTKATIETLSFGLWRRLSLVLMVLLQSLWLF